MTGKFIFGQYRPLDSIGHRLDPRAKLIITILMMVLALFTTSIMFYSSIISLTVVFLLVSKIKPKSIIANLKPFVFLVIITAVYHIVFSGSESKVLMDVWGLEITLGGLEMAGSFSLRILLFIIFAFFISLTTMPIDFAEGLVYGLKPLSKIGVPVEEIGLIIFIALRFIPVFAEEFETIKKAQMVRGVSFSGNLIKRSRSMISLLIPIFQSALRRADDLAIAIESRGYISGGERSSFRKFGFQKGDYVFMFIATLITVTLFIWAG